MHFIIQKLKNKHTFLKTEKAKSSQFDRTRGDKKQIFPTLVNSEEMYGSLKIDHEQYGKTHFDIFKKITMLYAELYFK